MLPTKQPSRSQTCRRGRFFASGEGQADLFAAPYPKAPALLAAMDGFNSHYGRNTVVLAAQGCVARSSDTKRSQKKPGMDHADRGIPVAQRNGHLTMMILDPVEFDGTIEKGEQALPVQDQSSRW